MGAGGACIAAYLAQGWQQAEILQAIESLMGEYLTNLR